MTKSIQKSLNLYIVITFISSVCYYQKTYICTSLGYFILGGHSFIKWDDLGWTVSIPIPNLGMKSKLERRDSEKVALDNIDSKQSKISRLFRINGESMIDSIVYFNDFDSFDW